MTNQTIEEAVQERCLRGENMKIKTREQQIKARLDELINSTK